MHDRLSPPSDEGERLPTISGTPPILSGTPARPPVHRTLYLEAPGASAWFDPSANHTVGLAMTFLGTFVATTFLVLAVFFAMTGEAEPPGLEPTAAMQPPAEAAAGSADSSIPQSRAPDVVHTPGAPGSNSGGAASTGTAVPGDGSSGAVVPGGADAPPSALERSAAALAGAYTGNIDGSPATFVIEFSPAGEMRAIITARDQLPTEARGSYRITDGEAHIDLEDEGAVTVSAYRGKISGQKLSGQVTLSTGEIRYFTATR